MAKFCTKCGSTLDETGRCPSCDRTNAASGTPIPATDTTPKQKKKRILLPIIAILLCLVIIAGSVLTALAYFNIAEIPIISDLFNSDEPKKDGDKNDGGDGNVTDNGGDDAVDNGGDDTVEDEDEDNTAVSLPPYEVPFPDADEYYEQYAKVLDDYSAEDSDDVQSEEEVYEFLDEKGLAMNPIITNYSMEGAYFSDMEISSYSSTLHPMYTTEYLNEEGEYWTISIVNGQIMAHPFSYNIQSDREAPVVIAEKDSLMSYDSTLNKFYETVPYESEMIIIEVDEINADTLEELTVEEIDEK